MASANADRRKVPARLTWADAVMELQPGQRVLELGFGNGQAVALAHKRIAPDGHVHAVDQSEIQVNRASTSHSWATKQGLVSFQHAPVADAVLEPAHFDVAFANNLNLFWTGPAAAELATVAAALKPGGSFYLFYEEPRPARALEVGAKVLANLTAAGWSTEVVPSPTGTQWGVRATR
ncbi:MAG: Methyltransferase type 12 [Thermoleophilia bacterium]|jgi:ubiquinone/menaquinone biosynthesis C-methylase UbiE|nr:Methyltransferase type 12 [Thermoleophilia bacterium]